MPEPRRTKLTGVCPLPSSSLNSPPPFHLPATKSNPKFQEFRLLLNINCCICRRRRLLDSVSLSFLLSSPSLSLFLSMSALSVPAAPRPRCMHSDCVWCSAGRAEECRYRCLSTVHWELALRCQSTDFSIIFQLVFIENLKNFAYNYDNERYL